MKLPALITIPLLIALACWSVFRSDEMTEDHRPASTSSRVSTKIPSATDRPPRPLTAHRTDGTYSSEISPLAANGNRSRNLPSFISRRRSDATPSHHPNAALLSQKAARPHNPGPLPQPAVWIELPGSPDLTDAQQQEMQAAAEELQSEIENSAYALDSPEYAQFWSDAVTLSDRAFRQRYGARAWLQHHIQAHHLAQPSK